MTRVSEGTLKKQAYKSNGIVAAPLHSLASEINVILCMKMKK